ncbi:histone-lysine N-methyltransferase 2D [Drosophila busckii]|nr:histone-lysine N-methyltransferase 2D [Drosophila busckii]
MPMAMAMPIESVAEGKSAQSQPHTVADFIIHPLIAFKPRQASMEELQGKQAAAAATPATNATPSSPGTWLFGMNPGQGLGSGFSTLAGSVSGWFSDRLAAAGQQIPALPSLPALMDTPVRVGAAGSTASPPTTTTSTTQRPEIVVRLQQRPNRRRNGNLNANANANRNRLQQRPAPNRFNNRLDSLESDEYDDADYFNGNRYEQLFDEEENEQQQQEQDDEDEEVQQLTQQRRPAQSQRRKQQQQPAAVRRPALAMLRPQRDEDEELEEEEEEDDDVAAFNDNDEEEEEEEEELESEESFLPVRYSQSSRKTQNFLQSSQQNLINQLRRLTFGQSPAELGQRLRKGGSGSATPNKLRRPQQATLLINRNGQPVYVAPELLQLQLQAQAQQQRQPPLTVPVRRQGQPTQYITIPWSQLGVVPPQRQSVVSLADNIQSQPLILNIPDGAISGVGGGGGGKKRKQQRPQLTAGALPLLADASLVDLFQAPQIPPSRQTTSKQKPKQKTKPKPQPVLIAAKPVTTANTGLGAGNVLPTRIRPGTIVEKAPAMDASQPGSQPAQSASESEQQLAATVADALANMPAQSQTEQEQYILVGEDNEPGLSRHVQPAYGDARRYVNYGDFHPYFDLLQQNRRYALHKFGRSLGQQQPAEAAPEAEPESVLIEEQQAEVDEN